MTKSYICGISLAFCTVGALFAGDTEDVINVTLVSRQCAAKLNFEQFLAHYTDDATLTMPDQTVLTVPQMKEFIDMLDGEHPYEALCFSFRRQKQCAPSLFEIAQLKVYAHTKEFAAIYLGKCTAMREKIQQSYVHELQNLQIRQVEIDGMQATITYFSTNWQTSDPKTVVLKLRKVDGVWKIYKEN